MIVLNINTDEIQRLSEGLDKDHVRQVLLSAAQDLSQQVHGHIVEQAHQKLRSRRAMYVENLDMKPADDGMGSMVVLYKPALWIEEGLTPHEMIDDLLGTGNVGPGEQPKRPANVSVDPKTGQTHRWKVIPFQHNAPPSTMPQPGLYLQDTLRASMKRMKIPYGTIERNPDGSVREGLLHKFDIEAPDHPHLSPATPYGPGVEGTSWQAQGPKSYRTRSQWTGDSYLKGVRIYQRGQFDQMGNPRLNKRGEHMGSRSIMTFRVVSEKQKGSGMWFHPGLERAGLFDDAFDWAKKTFDEEIAPSIIAQLL